MTNSFLSIRIRAAVALIALIAILTGCSAAPAAPAALFTQTSSPAAAQSGQFSVVDKDGVQIACPKSWSTDETDPSLVYKVSRAEFIRITVGVLPAQPQDFYDSLVSAGTVQQIKISGYPGYRNEYRYDYRGSQLVSVCYTAVQGDTACHIMTLCDVELESAFQPVFDYVLNSLRFK
jgi:hypothetical protein